MNGFKGLDLVHSVPEELWTGLRGIVQEGENKTVSKSPVPRRKPEEFKEFHYRNNGLQLPTDLITFAVSCDLRKDGNLREKSSRLET